MKLRSDKYKPGEKALSRKEYEKLISVKSDRIQNMIVNVLKLNKEQKWENTPMTSEEWIKSIEEDKEGL